MSNSQGQRDTQRDEAELIRAAQEGDRAAMDSLLAAHQDGVYRAALAQVAGNEEAAFELAQEVLVSAFRHLNQFRGESRLSTWLYRAVVNHGKNRAVAEGRRSKRFVALEFQRQGGDSSGEVALPLVSTTPDPRQQASANEAVAMVHQHLAALPEEFRSALLLRYVEDYSYEEIAAALGINLGTVKSRINRGRGMLRDAMGHLLEKGGMLR